MFYFKNSKECNRYIHENFDNKKLKSGTEIPYGKIVSVDDDGNLSSFEFPKGIIVAWSGNIGRIPNGWALCDGKTNGTPDLRGKFILGANPNSNKNTNYSVYEMGVSGGEEKHKLTINELPKHNHPGYINAGESGGDGYWYESGGYRMKSYSDRSFTGDDQPHNNMPPYYALAYIMKI